MDGADLLLVGVEIGLGFSGIAGYLYKIERRLSKKIDRIAVRVDCLQALHLDRHPEDKDLMDRICGDEPL